MPAQPLTVDMFVSVDGWAGGNGLPGYFGYGGPDLEQWITSELAQPELLLVGRRTYEILAAIPDEVLDDATRTTFAKDAIIFSRTLHDVGWPNTRISADDPARTVVALKAEGELPLRTMGSLSIARQLLDAGLVDRLRLMTFPLLAGPDGREPFFAGVACADLALVAHRVLDDRILLMEYAPTGRDIPRV